MHDRKAIFSDHSAHFVTFDDGTSPPPPNFARVETPLIVIIETHLFVESRLIMLVERSLKHPEELQLNKYGFERLVRLAAALGLVSTEEKPGLLELNRMRNKFAHNMAWKPIQQDVMALHDVLTPEQKSIASGLPVPADLNRLIVHVMCLLSAHFTWKSATAS